MHDQEQTDNTFPSHEHSIVQKYKTYQMLSKDKETIIYELINESEY